jgi:hypothetical protein
MRWFAALVLLVVGGVCTGPAAPAAQSSPASAARSQSPTPSVTTVALSCRLPITWDVDTGQGFVRRAGFLSFPNQLVSEDTNAPAGSWFYDRAFARWLPVFREAVSNDGGRYAYSEGNAFLNTGGRLHVVDLASGADRTIYSGNTVYKVVDFAPEGIYLTLQAPEGRSRGLWLQDPAGGAARLISRTVIDPWVAGGAAWGEDFDTSDPNPAPGGIEGPMNRLVRIDLQSGATTPWYSWLGADVYLDGVDYNGNPFVGVGRSSPSNTQELWLVTKPETAQRLFTGPANEPWPFHLAAIDTHGIWFDGGSYQTSPRTLWLYAGGAMRMAGTVNLNDMTVAGGCING